MDRPLDIAFHNTEPSDAVEADIRRHVAKLETRYPHLTACRVSIEAPHRQHRTGSEMKVHVVVSVPGHDIAASHGPHHTENRAANPDISALLRDAFRAAERQLDALKA